jgi:hypothetical protein
MSDPLTVSNGTNMAIVKLTGNYSSHSFHFVDDGNEISGKIVYASPVPTSHTDLTASDQCRFMIPKKRSSSKTLVG